MLLASVAPKLGPMNMEQATQFYLEEVLGIQHLIRPTLAMSSAQQQQPWESVGTAPTHILWTTNSPSLEEKQLISKMMAAAKLNSYIIFWGDDLEVLDSSVMSSVSAALLFFGAEKSDQNIESRLHLLKTASLKSMMEGSEASIQIHKKAAWEKIKELMAFLAERRGSM